MISTLKTFMQRNREELEEIKLYFKKCAEDIDRNNLYMLRKNCMWTSIVYLCMLFLANILIPRFRVTIGHLLLIPLIFVFFCINMYTRKNDRLPTKVVRALCLTYFFGLSMCFILMEINEESVHPSRWFPLILIVFPTIYIDRQFRYGIEETVMVLIYCVITYFYKEPVPFFRDVYTVMASYIMSMIISRVVLNVRSKQGLTMVELIRFSEVDKLTNVLNKGALIAEIDSYLKHRDDKSPCAMCIIDVDDFKQVNDGIGHNGGDQLLEHVGELLIRNFRPTDIIGRFGGDEFIVFMPGMHEVSLVEFRCKSLQMMLSEFRIDDAGPFTISIGAIVDEGGHSHEEIFRMADDALYKSKLAGKNQCSAWVIKKNQELVKPGLVFLTLLGEENADILRREENGRYHIINVSSDDEAIGYISQYHSEIKLVVAEVDDELKDGGLVVKYIKNRERFSSIPVLAVINNKDAESLARHLGADKVLYTEDSNHLFRETIKELTGN